jgi:dihydroflavonol-4-reductase
MNILVTGGCGFLGSFLVKKLLEHNHNVTVFDKVGCSKELQKEFGVEIIEGDICNYEEVNQAIKGKEIVFHTAAIVSFHNKLLKLQEAVNITGTKNVMLACLHNNIQKVIHTSSVNAIGFSLDNNPIDEIAPFNWEKYHIGYMNSKYEAEKLILNMVKKDSLPAIIVNPGTIFGKSTFSLVNANSYIINIAKKRIPFYPLGGTNCVGIEDVVKGQLLAMEKGKFGERYILGGENYSYKDLFNLIAEELNIKINILPLNKKLGFFISNILTLFSQVSGLYTFSQKGLFN